MVKSVNTISGTWRRWTLSSRSWSVNTHIINMLPCKQVKSEMAAEHFKPNCALVILKFMIRKGTKERESVHTLKKTGLCMKTSLFYHRTSLWKAFKCGSCGLTYAVFQSVVHCYVNIIKEKHSNTCSWHEEHWHHNLALSCQYAIYAHTFISIA